MSSSRLDAYIPDYIYAMPVVSGTTVYGAIVPLYGSAGFTVQGQCANGAAGAMFINPTNFASPMLQPFYQANGYPFAEYVSAQTIGANGHAGMKVSPTDNSAHFAAFYVSFVPSASGTLYIAVNVRKYGT